MQQWFGGLIDKAREAAPGLLGQLPSSTPSNQPTGYQPGSANEIVFSPEKPVDNARATQFADDGGRPLQERQPHDMRVQSFATDCDGGYNGDEDRYEFGAGYGARGGSLPSRGNSNSFSPQRQAGPPVIVDDHGLVTAPNGVRIGPQGMSHANVNTEGPYDSYHGNANLEGPYDHVPPTTPSLQMPPEHCCPPAFPYPAAPSSDRPAMPGGDAYGPGYSPRGSSPGTTPLGNYAPPGTTGVSGGWGHAAGNSLPSSSSRRDGASQREAWAPGSIVEVYSSSACSWYVARIIGDNGDIITVQFMASDGPKQKSLPRGDKCMVPLGARGGMPELPPGFQVKESQSRPGQQVFLDATTGVKYASLELAWSMHFERLAKNAPSGLERTVAGPQLRRLHEEASNYEPLGTRGGSFSHDSYGADSNSPLPQFPCEATGVPSGYQQLLTEGALLPSCRSDADGPQGQAMSLAELMNKSGRNYNSPPSHMPAAQQMPVSGYEDTGPMPTMGGKVVLPCFGERPPTDSQAAYLQHLADPGFAEATAMPFADRGSMAAPAQQGGDHYSNMHGFAPGQAPSVPRRAPPVQRGCPQQQAWNDDPFSQWRR